MKFPTPFSNPPGKGLSSPVINVMWGLINLIIGYLLLKAGKVSWEKKLTLIIFLIAFASMSIMLGMQFGELFAGR